MVVAGWIGELVFPPTSSPILRHISHSSGFGVGGFTVSAAEIVSSLVFSGPLAWTDQAACRGQNELFFAPAGERPETRAHRESKARAVCNACPALSPCRHWARENREYGYWGGESEEERAAAGFRVDMPVGRVARYPKGDGTPVEPRAPRVA
jgi:WhiB family transcriptional regulator, redox-sensing transcriptional regulator